jgi:hypothetical protein
MIGSQVSNNAKSLTISILVKKKVQVLAGGEAGNHEGDLVEDTIFNQQC